MKFVLMCHRYKLVDLNQPCLFEILLDVVNIQGNTSKIIFDFVQ
jgi:hypothetical protein